LKSIILFRINNAGCSILVWLGVALVAMAAWSGCAIETKVWSIKPAEVSMGGIRTLAVLKFDGRHGETVRSDFYNKLTETEHFNLINVTQINVPDKVIYDQVDDPRLLHVLKDLHADGVFTGRVTANINDIRGTDQVQVQEGTGMYKKEKNISGQWVDVEIKRTVLRPVPYVIRQASLTVDFKVFDLRTRRIIAAGKATENYKEKFGGDTEYGPLDKTEEPEFEKGTSPALAETTKDKATSTGKWSELPTPNQTLNELSEKVATRLVARISPPVVSRTVKFDDGGKYGIGAHKVVKRGIKFAKKGAWEEAMETWQVVINAEPYNAAAHYNLGLAHENIGDLENLKIARSMYKKAARYGNNTLYIDAMARVKAAIKDHEKYIRN